MLALTPVSPYSLSTVKCLPATLSRLILALLATIFIGGCRDTVPPLIPGPGGGTIIIAATSDPDALFPPATLNIEARQATELIYEYLADVGPAMNTIGDAGFVKELASHWKWAGDSLSIAFTIDPAARWHDDVPVLASDVVFSHAIYTDSAVGAADASDLADIDSVTARDSLTVVFWFSKRTPHQFFDAAAKMLILPKHLLGALPVDSLRAVSARMNPTGSGRYMFERWDHGTRLELRAVPRHHRGRPGPDRIVWTITPEYQSAVTRLVGGEADVLSNLRPETISALAGKSRFNIVTLPGMDYAFLQFNLRDPANPARPHALFSSRALRRALTMALDRKAMVQSLFDTLATVSIGPAVRALPTTDTSLKQIPHDPPGAGRLLDSLGWKRSTPTAIRVKNGKPLSFTLIVPVSSASRMKIAVLIQEALRQAGVGMQIETMDYPALVTRQNARNFEATLGAWHLGSSPGAIRVTWTSQATSKSGMNYGSYRNPRFDALVDSALESSSLASSRDYFRRANQEIVDDAPAIWLYEPKTVLAIDRRIRTTPMRPNAWWLDIGSWSIPPSERLPRDAPPGESQTRR